MNLKHLRLRLALAYVGVFALILLILGAVTVVSFSRELVIQQDILLTQEARNQSANLLNGTNREVLADGSDEFGYVALDLEENTLDADRAAPFLGLPDIELAREALRENNVVPATVQGSNGNVRVVSMPIYDDSGETLGTIQYARSLNPVRETLNELIFVLIPLGLGGLGLAILGGAYMAGRAVRPAREAFERQRAFIADASHELKTPLSLIRLDTEMLQRRLDDPEDKEFTGNILAETDRTTAVLSDLLLIARLDAGKLPVKQVPFDLADVIRETTGRFATRADSKSVGFEVRAPVRLRATGDREHTAQVLAVLLDNALRYTPGGGSITVTTDARDGFVETAVRDTGPGIPVEHLPGVFERFYRADAARSRSSGGTGLGLAIARDLARAQKGDLEAGNAKDGGAVFRLILPGGEAS